MKPSRPGPGRIGTGWGGGWSGHGEGRDKNEADVSRLLD